MTPRGPSRRDLLIVLTELQGLVGKAIADHYNDRDPNGFEKAQNALALAFETCIVARGFDIPLDGQTIRHKGLRDLLAGLRASRRSA